MTSIFSNLEPALLWKHFDELRKIPRCSGDETAVGDYVVAVAERFKLKYKRDQAGNIVVHKPATRGHEKASVVVLQGHLDMVCEKDSGVDHDFERDPIQVQRDGDWLTAKGTTLGADNGIGVAAALAVLEEDSLVHGPLELLFTVDEERGLTGASQIQPDFLKGRTFLNLDSEEEGAFFIGCSGGGDTLITVPLKRVDAPDGTGLSTALTGLRGGHSGIDIDQGRGNAIKLLTRMLWQVEKDHSFSLMSFEGGNKRNAIAREAKAKIIISNADVSSFRQRLQKAFEEIAFEFKAVEKDMDLKIEELSDRVSQGCDADSQAAFINLLLGLPHGVLAMSQEIPDLVETSNNLATVECSEDEAKIGLSSRSSIGSALQATKDMLRALAEMAGADISQPEGYPGWTPNLNSPILHVMKEIYRDLFGKEAEVKAIHAGLECGLIGERFPGMDMVSFGPDLQHPHSPEERVHIGSVENFWKLLTAALKRLAES
jgi:dipeptidase D